MRPVVDPPAARLHELTGANGRSVADDRDQIAMAARLDPQDAEAALLVVEGDALNQAGEVLALELRVIRRRENVPPLRIRAGDTAA